MYLKEGIEHMENNKPCKGCFTCKDSVCQEPESRQFGTDIRNLNTNFRCKFFTPDKV